MRITWRDAGLTVLVAAVVVPYVGYLLWGSVPFIESARGMSATGLVLGLAAAVIAGRTAVSGSAVGRTAAAAGLVSFGSGIVTLVLGDAGTVSGVLLAALMGGMAMAWALVVGYTGLPSSRLDARESALYAD